ncbi:MAG TPA: hypothetical protein VFO70_08805 [Chitinophagaceae bacterium]|nr:hypothetical protein [Chitinophagaceae bacterium]
MKKLLSIILLFLLGASGFLYAQQPGGGFPRRTVEERVQTVHVKIDSAFKLDAAKLTQVDSVFATFYRATDKVRQEMMSGGNRPDFQEMRQKMQPLVETRDKELKPLLGDDNFKKWKEDIEPSMMQRRGPGGNRQR